MAFSVNYLGANITQVGLNFSPGGTDPRTILSFIRLGFEGYKEVQTNSMEIAALCTRANRQDETVRQLQQRRG
ncbi:MAG: hypothetical protein ACLUEV_05815 [Alistipes sp.]